MRATRDNIRDLRAALQWVQHFVGDDGDQVQVEVKDWIGKIVLEPVITWYKQSDEGRVETTPDERKAETLAFLGTWFVRMTKAGSPTKFYDTYEVGAHMPIEETGWTLRLVVSSSESCDIVPVIDPETGEPMMEEVEQDDPDWVRPQAPKVKVLVPKTEKVCPPSFLQHAQ